MVLLEPRGVPNPNLTGAYHFFWARFVLLRVLPDDFSAVIFAYANCRSMLIKTLDHGQHLAILMTFRPA